MNSRVSAFTPSRIFAVFTTKVPSAAQPQASTVFKGSSVPVEVSVRVTGWPAGPTVIQRMSS